MANNEEISKGNETCSFCGKTVYDVSVLIAGPNAYICEVCIEVCAEVLIERDYEFATKLADTLQVKLKTQN